MRKGVLRASHTNSLYGNEMIARSVIADGSMGQGKREGKNEGK